MGGTLANGRYRLLQELGSGGMATVWRARDEMLQVDRAIKVLAPRLMASNTLRERFLTEARTMARLQHPNVVQVLDVGMDNEAAFMVMELLPGGSLADRLERSGALPPAEAAHYVLVMLEALGHAHRQGIVHRDIKPHNVLIDAAGRAKVSDFGIAHVDDRPDQLTKTGSVMGTVGFMAPEQRISARKVDGRADIYATGTTLFTLLTGQMPMDLYASELDAELLAGVPPALQPVIQRSTRYRPDDRYPDTASMAAALRAAIEGRPLPDIGGAPAEIQRTPTTPAPEESRWATNAGPLAAPSAGGGTRGGTGGGSTGGGGTRAGQTGGGSLTRAGGQGLGQQPETWTEEVALPPPRPPPTTYPSASSEFPPTVAPVSVPEPDEARHPRKSSGFPLIAVFGLLVVAGLGLGGIGLAAWLVWARPAEAPPAPEGPRTDLTLAALDEPGAEEPSEAPEEAEPAAAPAPARDRQKAGASAGATTATTPEVTAPTEPAPEPEPTPEPEAPVVATPEPRPPEPTSTPEPAPASAPRLEAANLSGKWSGSALERDLVLDLDFSDKGQVDGTAKWTSEAGVPVTVRVEGVWNAQSGKIRLESGGGIASFALAGRINGETMSGQVFMAGKDRGGWKVKKKGG